MLSHPLTSVLSTRPTPTRTSLTHTHTRAQLRGATVAKINDTLPSGFQRPLTTSSDCAHKTLKVENVCLLYITQVPSLLASVVSAGETRWQTGRHLESIVIWHTCRAAAVAMRKDTAWPEGNEERYWMICIHFYDHLSHSNRFEIMFAS